MENGADVTLENITLSRTSEDSTGGDHSSFYGIGAGLLAVDGSVTVNGGTFKTDAAGGGTMTVNGGSYTSKGTGSPAVYCTANITVSDADSQAMEGTILWDSISTLDVFLTDNSTWSGSYVQDESNAKDGGNGTASLSIGETSTWIVTGDSTLSSLSCEGTITDEKGNTVTIQDTSGKVYVEGNSDYTITVDSYSETLTN